MKGKRGYKLRGVMVLYRTATDGIRIEWWSRKAKNGVKRCGFKDKGKKM